MYKKTTTVEEYFDNMPPQMPPPAASRQPKLIQPILKINVPLMLKLLEYAKEEVKSEIELHEMVENMLDLSNPSVILGLNDFEDIVDIFESMPLAAACEPAPVQPEPTPVVPSSK